MPKTDFQNTFLGVDPPEVLHTLVHDEPVSGLRFDPRGRRMAVVAESLYLWDLSRHPPARTDVWPVPATNDLFQQTVELVFDPVESRLFYAQGNTVRRLDNGPPIDADPQRESTVTAVQSLAFTPDGRHLIAAVDRQGSRTIACWDFTALTKVPAAEIETGESHADDITISPDGRFFVFSAYKNDGSKYTLELWERTKDGPVRRDVADLEAGHPGSFWCTAFSPNGMTLASGHRDGRIRFWDVSKGRLKQLELNAYVASAGVGGIDFAPDGKTLASVDWDGRVGLWNLTGERGFRKDIFARHDARAYTVRYSPDGRLLASGNFEGGIKLTNLAAEEPHSFNLELHTGNITALEFTPDGRTLLSSGADGRVILWDVDTQEPHRQWHFPGHVYTARFDPSGRHIVSANGNGTIYVWRP